MGNFLGREKQEENGKFEEFLLTGIFFQVGEKGEENGTNGEIFSRLGKREETGKCGKF